MREGECDLPAVFSNANMLYLGIAYSESYHYSDAHENNLAHRNR
jgi:hypothetical protein